jgi:hypothetical protein
VSLLEAVDVVAQSADLELEGGEGAAGGDFSGVFGGAGGGAGEGFG